jgi:hypothetical protein
MSVTFTMQTSSFIDGCLQRARAIRRGHNMLLRLLAEEEAKDTKDKRLRYG